MCIRDRAKAKFTGKVVHRKDYETEYELKIKPLEAFNDLSKTERIAKLEKLIEQRIRKLVKERKDAGKSFLGRKAILAQNPKRTFPKQSAKNKRPVCYTKCIGALAEFRAELKEKLALYKEASIKYRLGIKNVVFPHYCYYPPLHHIPKEQYFAYS